MKRVKLPLFTQALDHAITKAKRTRRKSGDFTGNCPNCRAGSIPKTINGKLVHVSKRAINQDCWNQPPTVEPIPKRLYCCDGLIFGLIDGGQDDSYHPPITWKPFKPVSRVSHDPQKEARTK
ncbi:MAG TPA: hypothetical protein VFY05_04670 [Candidatus Angelobacter sp.]|nr:hypothetical protein [Candidatus Angelobacter sp.]